MYSFLSPPLLPGCHKTSIFLCNWFPIMTGCLFTGNGASKHDVISETISQSKLLLTKSYQSNGNPTRDGKEHRLGIFNYLLFSLGVNSNSVFWNCHELDCYLKCFYQTEIANLQWVPDSMNKLLRTFLSLCLLCADRGNKFEVFACSQHNKCQQTGVQRNTI